MLCKPHYYRLCFSATELRCLAPQYYENLNFALLSSSLRAQTVCFDSAAIEKEREIQIHIIWWRKAYLSCQSDLNSIVISKKERILCFSALKWELFVAVSTNLLSLDVCSGDLSNSSFVRLFVRASISGVVSNLSAKSRFFFSVSSLTNTVCVFSGFVSEWS